MFLFVFDVFVVDKQVKYSERLVLMLAVCRCGENRPHALFAFDAMLLTAGEQQIVIIPFVLMELAECCALSC